jgi:hypothetical protein
MTAKTTKDGGIATRVFPEWRGQPLDEILYQCRELAEDMDFPTVRRWREAGGKVLGHFQVYFPEEIAHAGGLLPFKVRGASVEATQAESRFGSYLCSILKTSLELVLSGRVELERELGTCHRVPARGVRPRKAHGGDDHGPRHHARRAATLAGDLQ